jgi:sulfite exporter TauE/SafE
LFVIGLLNGLLPCGFVYVGIAGSISTGSWLIGMLYMTLFGLGTFPIMFAASLFGKIINVKVRQKINKLIPAFTLILALLFILRGMNLGIPYLSPKLSSSSVSNSNTECH